MAGFFDKLKQGAVEAGKKTQVTVEINRLKLQISTKEKDISKVYTSIGEMVYEAMQQENLEEIYPQVLSRCQEISAKKEEIQQISEKVRLLRDEKMCPACDKVAKLDTKFCSGCGHHFSEDSSSLMDEKDLQPDMAVCPSCDKEMESDSKFCGHCGYSVTSKLSTE